MGAAIEVLSESISVEDGLRAQVAQQQETIVGLMREVAELHSVPSAEFRAAYREWDEAMRKLTVAQFMEAEAKSRLALVEKTAKPDEVRVMAERYSVALLASARARHHMNNCRELMKIAFNGGQQ